MQVYDLHIYLTILLHCVSLVLLELHFSVLPPLIYGGTAMFSENMQEQEINRKQEINEFIMFSAAR